MANNDVEIQPSAPRTMKRWETAALGTAFFALAALMVYLLVALWPEKLGEGANKDAWDRAATVFGMNFCVRFETRLILLVAIAGALGSYVHGATSFATYVGNRTLVASWAWWYLLRAPIGVALALLFYFVLRGGLLSAGAGGDQLSPFGVAAVAGLVGMFSKQAIDKLRETFDNLFRTEPGKGDEERSDKAEEAHPLPVILTIEPKGIAKGAAAAQLTINGQKFVETSAVHVKGAKRPTQFKSDTQLIVDLKAEDLATLGTLDVTVVTPPPGGGTSNMVQVTVT